MLTDEYGGIAKSSLPAVTDEYGGVASRPETDEYGGVAKGLQPAPPPVTDGQKFQANPGVQAAADQYVKDKWSEYGRNAGASEGQAIRDFAHSTLGVSADPSRIPALDYRPERDAQVQAAYARSSIANQRGGLDRVQKLEDQWRAEYLQHALPSAVAQQQDAANAPKPEDVGLIHGHANALLRGAAKMVMDPVEGGSELWYALGSNNADDGLHGANPNLTRNQLARNATMAVLHEMDDRINNAYRPSSNAQAGGFAKNTEGFVEMLPSLMLAKGMHGPAEGLDFAKKLGVYGQNMLTFGQMGLQQFGDTYQTFYKTGRAEGLDDNTASNNALVGGLAAAAVNTYLMKFGAAGNTGPSSVVRSALTATVHDALAQGAVGTGQGMTAEIAKYIATGESAKIENVIEQAKQGAGAGMLFGVTRGIHEGVANRARQRGVKPTEAAVSSDSSEPPVPDAKLVDLARINKPSAPVVDEYGGVAKGTDGPEPKPPVAGVGSGPDDGGGSRGPSAAGQVAEPAGGPPAPDDDLQAAVDAISDPSLRPKLATPLLDKQTPKLRVNNPDGSSTAKPIDFDSTIDKALYAATEPRQGKIGKEATAYLESQGYDADRIAAEGEMVRDRVAAQHDPKADRITVPSEDNAPREHPEPAPVPVSSDPGNREGRMGLDEAAVQRAPETVRPGDEAAPGKPGVDPARGERNPPGEPAVDPRDLVGKSEKQIYDGVRRMSDAELAAFLEKGQYRLNTGSPSLEREVAKAAGQEVRRRQDDSLRFLDHSEPGLRRPGPDVRLSPDESGRVREDETNANLARRAIADPTVLDSLRGQSREKLAAFLRDQLRQSEGMKGRERQREIVQKALDRLENGPHPYRDELQTPAADGYKTEMDRAARKAAMERVRGETDLEQRKAMGRITSKPERAAALGEMQNDRVPTPDAPTTDKEALQSVKAIRKHYPDSDIQAHRPANREQSGLARLIEQVTGRRVVYVSSGKGELPFKGVAMLTDPRTAFVRNDLTGPELIKTAWHEFWHTFQAQNPELARELIDLVPPEMRQAADAEYLKRAGGPGSELGQRLTGDADLRDTEAGATLFEKMSVNPRVMERLTGDQRSALRKFVDWVKEKLGVGRPLSDVERKMRDYLDRVADVLREGERMEGENDDMADDGFDEHGNDLWGLGRTKESGKAADPAPVQAPLGAEKFGKEVKDAGKDAVDAMRSAWDGIKRWFAPTLRGPEAERAAGILREAGADYAQRMDRLNAAFEKSKAYMDTLPKAVTRDFWEKMEKGQPQTDPKLQPMADAMRAVYDDRLAAIQGLGTGKLTKFIENYVNHLYKEKSAGKTLADMGARRPWEGNKGFLKQRKHALFSDAFAAGLNPLTENPVEMMQMYARQADKYIVAQRAFQEMRKVGLAVKVTARDVAKWRKKGYEQINDKIATIYAPPNRRGGLSIAGYYMAPEPVATIVNNHLSPGLRSDPFLGKAFRMYQGVGNVMNQVQLGVSGYHAMFTTFDAAVAKMSLGIEHANKGHWKQAAIEAAKSLSLGEPAVENYLDGKKLHEEWLVPGSHPDYAPFVDAFKAGGGRDGQDPFYHTDFREKMKQAWKQGNIIGAAVRGPLAAIEGMSSPILEHLVPRLKEGAWMNLARLEFGPDGKGLVGLSRDEIRQKSAKIWDSVENRLGEMTYDNLFWNRTAKDLAMASTRAVGWNLGTIRELGGGTLDTAKALGRLATGKRPELTHRMAYTLALPMMTALVGGITHRLMTGQNPQELKDYFYPGTGELDKSGHMVRLQMPGYMADMLKYGHDMKDAYTEGKPALAVRTLGHKTHPMVNTIMEMLNNEDYYGDKIRNEGDPFIKRRLDEIKFMGQQFVPFGLRDVAKLHDEGQGVKSLLPLAGIVRARTDVTRSDAENMAAHLMREEHPPASRTQDQRDHEQSVRDLSDSLRAHEPDAVDKIRKAASDGTLNQGDIDHIRQDQKTPDLLGRMVKRLEAPAGIKVWDAATPDERRRIGPILMGKVRSSKTMTRDEKVAAVSKLQSDLKGNAPQAEEGE